MQNPPSLFRAVLLPPALLWIVVMAALWLHSAVFAPLGDRVAITLWFTILCGLAVLGIRARQKKWTAEHRREHGLCVGCGYDLRECKGRCPECGLLPAGKGGDLDAGNSSGCGRGASGGRSVTVRQKILFGNRLIRVAGSTPFAVVQRGRVFVGPSGSVKQVEGERAWLATSCACGGRAVRYCARCGREQSPARGRTSSTTPDAGKADRGNRRRLARCGKASRRETTPAPSATPPTASPPPVRPV